MFVWKKAKSSDDVTSLTKTHGNGASRRAINMLPSAAPGQREILQTTGLRYHQLLVTLEGNKRTGVVKVVNPRRRSRAAILMYRGRVLGCVYGRKGLDGQVMSSDAHSATLADLATTGNLVDAYQLSEDIVLGAASMFHGEVLEISKSGDAISQFDGAVAKVKQANKPGCVVINSTDGEMKAMVYVSKGQIMGVFCAEKGWVEPNANSAHKIIKHAKNAIEVSASILSIESLDTVDSMSFSLSGLADRERYQLVAPILIGIDNVGYQSDYIQPISTYSTQRGMSAPAAAASWKTAPITKGTQTFNIQP